MNGFKFGVPLEDMSPENVHPKLKFLIDMAYQSYHQSGLGIGEILSNANKSNAEQDALKILLEFAPLDAINRQHFSSPTYFWAIRYFLDQLPLPLMGTFRWETLQRSCRRQKRSDSGLLIAIAGGLNELSPANFNLLKRLRKLFGHVAIRRNARAEKRLDVAAAKVFIEFYHSSFFVVKSFQLNPRKDYRHLMLKIFISWTEVANHLRNTSKNLTNNSWETSRWSLVAGVANNDDNQAKDDNGSGFKSDATAPVANSRTGKQMEWDTFQTATLSSERVKCSTPVGSLSSHLNTYVKFPDVFDSTSSIVSLPLHDSRLGSQQGVFKKFMIKTLSLFK